MTLQKGTNQAKHHKDGTLGYIGDDYILEPIGAQSVVAFYVPENTHNTQKYISGNRLSCRKIRTCFMSPVPSIRTERIISV